MAQNKKPSWRQSVADEMIKHIEAGTSPWQKGWDAGVIGQAPHNATNDKAYRGINSLWLDMQGYEDPRWLTYKQAAKMDAQVQGGEKSTQVEYWKWTDTKPILSNDGVPVLGDDGKMTFKTVRLERPQVFYANVFNAAQINGLEPYIAPKPKFEPVQEAERLLDLGGVKIKHGGNQPFYAPIKDQIQLPKKDAFKNAYEYYATALHELGHATGHKSRMARDFGPFGSEVYAKEELRAEMSSFMVARELGLGHYPERHAPYVESWLKALKNDHNLLFQAARDADRIATWIKEPDLRQKLEQAAQQKNEGKNMDRKTNDRTQDQSVKPAEEKSKRTYLAVPFVEKDQAKAAGAKWDRKLKSWYAPEGMDLAPLDKWKADQAATLTIKQRPQLDPMQEFSDELKKHGVSIKGAPVMDGKWHRVRLNTDKGKTQTGSYRAFLDGLPNGQIKIFNVHGDGESHKWVATGQTISNEQLAAFKTEGKEKQAAHIKERDGVQNNVAKVSKKRFGESLLSSPEGHNSPYLKRKKVANFGLGYDKDGNVMVPVRDINNKLWSVQTIGQDGEKRFAKGGRKTGLMHIIDPDQKIGEKASQTSKPSISKGTILIAEGYATAASIYEATHRPTIVAFDAGNLLAVAKAVHEKYPKAQIIIAGDNDHKLENKQQGNIGKIKAVEAARAVDGYAVIPDLTPEQKKLGLSDWNDLSNAQGKATLPTQMRQQLHQLGHENKQTSRSPEEQSLAM